jgi:hypothetical protein
MGRDVDALEVIERGIESASKNNNSELLADMLRHNSLIKEKSSLFDESLKVVEEALGILEKGNGAILILQLAVAKLRLLRKLRRDNERRSFTKEILAMITPEVIQSLLKLPTLLREATAELGNTDDRLMQKTIETIGIDAGNDEQKDLIADVLVDWDAKIKESNEPTSLSDYARLGKDAANQKGWRKWVDDNEGANLDKFIKQSLRRFELTTDLRDSLMDTFKTTVDQSIIGKFKDKI